MRGILLSATAVLVASVAVASASDAIFRLSGWAEIPSTYRHPGPVSGQFTTGPVNGVTPPYQGQPIPGFSGMIPAGRRGRFFALPDNGFGAQTNSADFVIGFYMVTPHFKTKGDGTTSRGPVTIHRFTPFSDPKGLLDLSYITGGPVYNRVNYYPTGAQIPVDPAIGHGRLLTGADFDVESFTQMNDGTFWVGEEFGPYLLHFDAQGRLLSAPVRHPVLRAPQNPQNATQGPSNLPSSRGFESMTSNGNGSKLYVTTEASIASEPDKRILEIYEFDTRHERYTGRTFKYAKDSSDAITGGMNDATNIFVTGDMTHLAGDRYIIIERDDFQGPPSSASPPRQKKLYLIDLQQVDPATGILKKRLLVDLLHIGDPKDIGGPLLEIPADTFDFPLQSVESVTPVDPFTLLVGLDNNYPGGNGRVPGTPDGTEIITLRARVPLRTLRVQRCTNVGLGSRDGAGRSDDDADKTCP
jgi:hypothetical protein